MAGSRLGRNEKVFQIDPDDGFLNFRTPADPSDV